MTDPVPARVVVVGGGFAGVACARKLAASKDFHVTLSAAVRPGSRSLAPCPR